MRRVSLSIVGLFVAVTLITPGCGSASGNSTAPVGHDGKAHGEIKAPNAGGNHPAARKAGPRR
jgi:hypothetical protein